MYSKTGDVPRRLAWLLFVALMTLLCGDLRAQTSNSTVAATLDDPVVDVGEATQYKISVLNGRADNPPAVPTLAGLTFQYVGQASEHSFFLDGRTGARTLSSTVYTYNVRAIRPGRYAIPGQEVMVGGASLRTLPVTLNAQDNGTNGATPPAQTVSTELIIPKKSAYVGESIPVEVRSYFGTEVGCRPDPDVVLNGDGFSVQKFTPPQAREQVIDGSHLNVVFYKSAVTGLKTGDLTIGPAETNPVVQLPAAVPRHRRSNGYDVFGGLFGGTPMQPPARVKMQTDPVTVEVRPLPPGKPADFSGAVGQFKLDVEAEPRHAQAGDPVTVRLLLSGQGNFERITAPTLADEQGLKTYPPSAKFKADDEVGLSGVKTFEQVVIADGARASLPAYRFNYLDPSTGKYMSLDTPPVAVRVDGGSAPPAPSAALAQQNAPAPTATPVPTPARPAEDILYIRADPGTMRDRAAFLPVYERRSFWLMQGGPLAVLLAALAVVGLRARARHAAAGGYARRQREQAELQNTLRKKDASRQDFYVAAARLAQLRAAGSPVTAPVQEIYQRRDELTYSGGQVALEPVPAEERRGVLATLGALGKNGK